MPAPEPTPGEEEIFQNAAALPPAERQEYLEEACAGQPELRAAVNRLLASVEDDAFMLRPSDRTVSPEMEAEFARLKPEEAGDRIGVYKLLQQIGEGGFGMVWMAEQEKPVRRRVALKIIKLGMDTKEVIARFEQERQALALMDHPNIARVFDAGATATGRPFFVMELVKGVRITEYCDAAQLTTSDRLRLFVQVCNAVQHAHQKGIIHRDLKPSNILVTLHDGVPVPKVIDFGVAKATMSQRLTDLTLFTQFEQMIGTPLYMAPEQAELSGLDIDTRSDIYSLGVLLYELLTGRTPFDPEQLMKAGFDEMRRVIREEEPQKPSTFLSTMAAELKIAVARHRGAEGAKLISSIRGDLDWIVMKALEKDRNRRYETASGFARDVERHLQSEPVHARPPTASYRFRRMVRRNKVAFGAATAVFAALLIALIVSTWMFLQEKRARERAVAAEKVQEEERSRAQTEASNNEQVVQFFQRMLRGVGPSVAAGRDTTMLREILDQTADDVGKDLKDQPIVEASLRGVIGDVYQELGDLDKAEAMDRQALALLRAHLEPDDPMIAACLMSLGSVLLLLPTPEAEVVFREALEIHRKSTGAESEEVGRAMTALAMGLRKVGKASEAESMARAALQMNKKLLGGDHPSVAESIGVLLQTVGLLDAVQLHREVLGIFRKVHGNDHPSITVSLLNLSEALRQAGLLAEAESAAREGLAIQRKIYGSEHIEIAGGLKRLALSLEAQGKPEEAESLHREAFTMSVKLRGSEYAAGIGHLDSLLNVLSRNGKQADAEAILREQLESGRQKLGKGPVPMVTLKGKLARLLMEQGRLTEAEALYREALETRRKIVANVRPPTTELLNALSEVLEAQGRLDEVEPLQREAMAFARSAEGPDTVGWLEKHLLTRGEHLFRKQRFAEAEPLLRELVQLRRARLGHEHQDSLGAIGILAGLLTDCAWNDYLKISSTQPRDSGGGANVPHQRAREAETLMREVSAIVPADPSLRYWRRQIDRSQLGAAMLAVDITDPEPPAGKHLARLPEIEKLLVESWGPIHSNLLLENKYRRDALIRLIRLYQIWDKPDEVAKWQTELDRLD